MPAFGTQRLCADVALEEKGANRNGRCRRTADSPPWPVADAGGLPGGALGPGRRYERAAGGRACVRLGCGSRPGRPSASRGASLRVGSRAARPCLSGSDVSTARREEGERPTGERDKALAQRFRRRATLFGADPRREVFAGRTANYGREECLALTCHHLLKGFRSATECAEPGR